MATINDGGPAFPLAYIETNEHGVQFPFTHPGMSKRDWFAGQIAANMAGHVLEMAIEDGETPDRLLSGAPGFAVIAYRFADAMIAAGAEGGDHG